MKRGNRCALGVFLPPSLGVGRLRMDARRTDGRTNGRTDVRTDGGQVGRSVGGRSRCKPQIARLTRDFLNARSALLRER